MPLVDHELKVLVAQALEEGQQPLLSPFVGHKVTGSFPSYGLQSAGYDLRLNPDESYVLVSCEDLRGAIQPFLHPEEPEIQKRTYSYGYPRRGYIVIPPGTLALGTSLEYFSMPVNIVGVCHGKSTYSRLGLIMNVTPIEPGWRGFLTIEMFNHNPNPVGISIKGGVLQVQFHLLESTPEFGYHGSYQDQEAKVVPAQVRR